MDNLDLGCFADSYVGARHNVLAAANRLDHKVDCVHKVYRHPLTGPQNQELACDAFYAGRSSQPRHVLVVISATHGIEGFAGSAIQAHCFPWLEKELQQRNDVGLVLLHALNPWGFAWLRRCDHEGIDINRNFVDFSKPPPNVLDLSELRAMLSRPEWSQDEDVSHLWQPMGLTPFVDRLTSGQFYSPDYCFYGGAGPSWSRGVLELIGAEPFITNADTIAVVDIHTGLGPYGYGELINDHCPGTSGFLQAQKWYGDNATSTWLGESCSGVKQGLMDYFWHDLMGERGCFVTLEFGTFPIQRLLSSLIREQFYHNNCIEQKSARDLSNVDVQALKAFFYPGEPSWKQQVLFRGKQVLAMALRGITQ